MRRDELMENEQRPSQHWLNTVNGKAFLAGMIMPMGCFLTSVFLRLPSDDTNAWVQFLYCGGILLITAGVFTVFQKLLMRRGFEGFDLTDRHSVGKGSAYLLFFIGAVVSIAMTFAAIVVFLIITNLSSLP